MFDSAGYKRELGNKEGKQKELRGGGWGRRKRRGRGGGGGVGNRCLLEEQRLEHDVLMLGSHSHMMSLLLLFVKG